MPSSPIPKPGSVEWGAEKAEDETRIRRSALSPDKLITQPWEGIDTVYDVLEYAARTHGTKNAYGYRNVVDIHEEEKEVKKVVDGKEITEKKTWKYFQLSEYKYLSFEQVKEAAREIAGGLLELGVQKTDVVNVYAATRCVPLCSSPSFLPQYPNAPYSCALRGGAREKPSQRRAVCGCGGQLRAYAPCCQMALMSSSYVHPCPFGRGVSHFFAPVWDQPHTCCWLCSCVPSVGRATMPRPLSPT